MRRLRLRHCLAAWAFFGLGFLIPFSQTVKDPDLWWHIKTGELILAGRAIPQTDPFSFTTFGHPWTLHEWLSEIFFYLVFSNLGFIGIMATKATFITLMFIGLYLLVRTKTQSRTAALLITVVAGLAGWQLWHPRPQLFTYLFLIILLFLLDNPRSRALWLAVPMFWLWSNLHGAWIFGLAVMTIVLAEAGIAAHRVGKTADLRHMAAVYAACIAALLAGPFPLERLTYPAQYFTGSIPTKYVVEFQSPDIHAKSTLPYLVLLASIPVVLYLGRKPMRVSEWILLFGTAILSLKSLRHVPLFAIVSAPILASQIESAVQEYGSRIQGRKIVGRLLADRREFWPLNLLTLVLLALLIAGRIPAANDEIHCTRPYYPRRACNFLLSRPKVGEGRLLNNYNWGGYLIFRLYPRYRVSIDGRADLHRSHMVNDLLTLEELSPRWKDRVEELDPDVVVWPVNKPLFQELLWDEEWLLIYEDEIAAVFVRERDKAPV